MVYGMWFMYELLDYETLKKYVEKVRWTVELHGGRYLASDGNVEIVEGTYSPKRTVIVEFADREMLGKWYESPDYQEILPYRLKGATGTAIVVHGVESQMTSQIMATEVTHVGLAVTRCKSPVQRAG